MEAQILEAQMEVPLSGVLMVAPMEVRLLEVLMEAQLLKREVNLL